MSLKELTVTNKKGDSISFINHLRLVNVDGLSGLEASNNYSESTLDGSILNSTMINNRNIEVRFKLLKQLGHDDQSIESYKAELYKVFNPKNNPVKFNIKTKADKEYYLYANADHLPVFSNESPAYIDGLIQFSCNDPFIYDNIENKVDIAFWVGAFEFPLEIQNTGIEMGYRAPSLFVNVLNEGQIDTGMTIRFKALGSVNNPKLINVNTQDFIKINTSLVGGDVIEISTYKGNKYVKLLKDGEVFDSFNYLDISSNFLQLEIGDNIFRYDADLNVDNLEVDIRFRNILLGV